MVRNNAVSGANINGGQCMSATEAVWTDVRVSEHFLPTGRESPTAMARLVLGEWRRS